MLLFQAEVRKPFGKLKKPSKIKLDSLGPVSMPDTMSAVSVSQEFYCHLATRLTYSKLVAVLHENHPTNDHVVQVVNPAALVASKLSAKKSSLVAPDSYEQQSVVT